MIIGDSTPTNRPFAPCMAACPVQTDARRYVALIARERYAEALDVIMAANPLPSVVGRICAHPCEQACRRGQTDEPIAICHLKRFVTDKLGYSDGRVEVEAVPKTKDKKIAVIGAGPAGLTAARDLAVAGYDVTIYEKHAKPGGMLRYGILDYRLPPDVLEGDIDNILAVGIELKCNVDVGRDIDFQELINDNDAVLVAAGLSVSRSIPIAGVDLKGVHLAMPVLEAINERELPVLGNDVIVIGGGNVAVDVARSIRRLGDKTVKMVCLEARDEMPAHDWEIEDAMAEGVEIHCSWGPDKLVGENGYVTGLEFKECTCVFDENRRFNPRFDESKRNVLPADTVILAIGQGSDLGFLESAGIKLNNRGQIEFDRATMRTSNPQVFGAGEVVKGPGAAIQAIADGHRAAEAVMADFEDREPRFQSELAPVGPLPPWIASKISKTARRSMPRLDEKKRLNGFDEVELGYSDEDALRESQRCLNCTAGAVVDGAKCAACLTCVRVCPYDVPEIIGDKAYMDPLVCQSCGICASECPARAITVKTTEEHLFDVEAEGGSVVGFVCQFGHAWGADRTYDVVGHLPENVKLVQVLCPSRLEPADILRAFEHGAERVFVTVCGGDYCHYKIGNGLTRRRLDYLRSVLDGAGIGGDKLVGYSIDHDTCLADIVTEMSSRATDDHC